MKNINHKKKNNKSKLKKILSSVFVVFLAAVMMVPLSADACKVGSGNLSKSNYSDTSGSLYFHIEGDGKTSDIRLKFSGSSISQYNFNHKSSTWTVQILGTNNHSVRFSNGGTSMKVSTLQGTNGEYTVFSIPFTMSLSAHYHYTSSSDSYYNSALKSYRMNFQNYKKEGGGTNTAKANMTHANYTRTVSFNMSVNAVHCGIVDYQKTWKKWYNSVISLKLIRDTHTVNFVNGLGTTLKSQSVTDGGAATPPANPTRTGYTFAGWSGTYSAPICSSRTITATWRVNTYTNSISHWIWGLTKGEGNNGSKNAYNIANTSFSATYGSSYSMSSSRATTVPKGFYLASTFGTPSISGSWASYSMGRTVTQTAASMAYEYDYNPYNYSISYNLSGGTNNSSNPSTYNILYGFKLSDPTRKGFIFKGWVDENSNPITGINQGVTNNFTSVSDMHSKLNARTIGNRTLTARWVASEPPEININPNKNNTGNPIAPFVDGDNLIVQLGDNFNPLDYVSVKDDADENPVVTVKDTNLPLINGVLTQSGTFTVTYKAENKYDLSSEKTITVIVNEPPVITSEDRYVLPDFVLTSDFLLSKVNATDKEDGNIKTSVTIASVTAENGNTLTENEGNYGSASVGKYEVTVTVTDAYHKTVTNTFYVHCVNDLAAYGESHATYMRFISDELLTTLNEKSIYKTNEVYKTKIETSLSKEKENAQTVLSYSADEVKEVKEFQEEQGHKRSQTINQIFMNIFK